MTIPGQEEVQEGIDKYAKEFNAMTKQETQLTQLVVLSLRQHLGGEVGIIMIAMAYRTAMEGKATKDLDKEVTRAYELMHFFVKDTAKIAEDVLTKLKGEDNDDE